MPVATAFDLDTLGAIIEQGDLVELRHDVDFDPECALMMAEFEHAAMVKATYYFMARGDYNPFKPENTQIIRRIRALGHDIGLHVELGLGRDAETPDWLLRRACSQEHTLWTVGFGHGFVTRKVAFHAPPRSVYWRPVNGWEHALSPRWESLYLSDSRGVWRQDPLAFITEKLDRGVRPQILLHPEWWFWSAEKADAQREIEAAKP